MLFFFKQKTAYEMRESDWSSDVCSSDLTFHDILREKTRSRYTDKDIRTLGGPGKVSFIVSLIGDACQILCCHVHVPGTALVDRTVNIDHRQVCYAQAIEQFANGRTCGAAAVHHNLDLCNVLFGKAQEIGRASCRERAFRAV